METPRVKHVVVDAIAFFKNVQLQDIADNVYTDRGVISEIRDSATRKRLAVLPYELKCREPSSEARHIVADFAKKTGDYTSLSAVDLRVLALAYQITKENIGVEHLFKHPDPKESQSNTVKPVQNPNAVVGFVYPKSKSDESKHEDPSNDDDDRSTEEHENKLVEQLNQLNTANTAECTAATSATNSNTTTEGDIKLTLTELETGEENRTGDLQNQDSVVGRSCSGYDDTREHSGGGGPSVLSRTSDDEKKDEGSEETRQDDGGVEGVESNKEEERCVEEGEETTESEEEEGDGGVDEDGWITPNNISKAQHDMGGVDEEADDIEVGCMTTDFAMQNVLIQMGIPVLSVNGLRIRRAKSYVLRCYGCFKTTTNMNKKFCPACGNQTMTKVSVSVDETTGGQQLYFSKRKTLNKRGLKYSIPMPQGGKHADNPILVADQQIPQNRIPRKARVGTDVFNPDFVANASPFAQKDVTSRSALLGTARLGSGTGSNRRNPNQSRKTKGKKK